MVPWVGLHTHLLFQYKKDIYEILEFSFMSYFITFLYMAWRLIRIAFVSSKAPENQKQMFARTVKINIRPKRTTLSNLRAVAIGGFTYDQ